MSLHRVFAGDASYIHVYIYIYIYINIYIYIYVTSWWFIRTDQGIIMACPTNGRRKNVINKHGTPNIYIIYYSNWKWIQVYNMGTLNNLTPLLMYSLDRLGCSFPLLMGPNIIISWQMPHVSHPAQYAGARSPVRRIVLVRPRLINLQFTYKLSFRLYIF